uniref:DNA-directed RNA polymerase n=1 Tax=Panagrolaimus sp. JU765 TaxID=591449 RepID=A0AC34RBC4_9BILA
MISTMYKEVVPQAIAVSIVDSVPNVQVYDLLSKSKLLCCLPFPLHENNLVYWRTLFQRLRSAYPNHVIKSVVFKSSVEPNSQPKATFMKEIIDTGYEFGIDNIQFVTDLVIFLTSQLLLPKVAGKKYEIGDYVLVGKFISFPILSGQFHLLQKQEIGWNVVAGKAGFILDFSIDAAADFTRTCLDDFGIHINQINSFIIDIHPLLKVTHNYDSIIKTIFIPQMFFSKTIIVEVNDPEQLCSSAGEYLSQVYSGEEYFNDYDCYVGNICEYKFELEVNESTIELPVQFKRLPCTVEKKINLGMCRKFQSVISHGQFADSLSYNLKKLHLHEFTLRSINETVIVKVSIDKYKSILCEVYKDNVVRTRLIKISSLMKFKIHRYAFIFGKDYCGVNYHKEGLQWNLKDINGNVKMPFKISFDKEIYIGDAASEHPEFLLSGIDLEMLLNPEYFGGLPDYCKYFQKENEKDYKIVIKTADGLRKTTPEIIVAIFMKSILILLEEKLNDNIEEVYLKMLFCNRTTNATNLVFKKACNILGINGILYDFIGKQRKNFGLKLSKNLNMVTGTSNENGESKLPQKKKKILQLIDPNTNFNILDDLNPTSCSSTSNEVQTSFQEAVMAKLKGDVDDLQS